MSVATPVPPFPTTKVPLKVIAPDVAVLGVNPVVPPLNVLTPPDGACQDAVVPFEVNTYVLAPIPSLVALLVPFPIIKSPVVVMGDNALKAVEAVV